MAFWCSRHRRIHQHHTYLCSTGEVIPHPEESGGSSNVVLYVGIGVGVLVVAVCVSVAFHCLQKKPPAKELENHSEMRSREGVAEDTESEDRVELALSEVTVKCEEDVELYRTGEEE